MGLLARCGVGTGVLLSTCGRLDRRAQGAPLVHELSPPRPRLIPSPGPSPGPGRSRRCRPAPALQQDFSGKLQVEEGVDGRARSFEAEARPPADRCRRDLSTASARPGHGPERPGRRRDLPNLCTFLGTTSRPVDAGHDPHGRDYTAASRCGRPRHPQPACGRPGAEWRL